MHVSNKEEQREINSSMDVATTKFVLPEKLSILMTGKCEMKKMRVLDLVMPNFLAKAVMLMFVTRPSAHQKSKTSKQQHLAKPKLSFQE